MQKSARETLKQIFIRNKRVELTGRREGAHDEEGEKSNDDDDDEKNENELKK